MTLAIESRTVLSIGFWLVLMIVLGVGGFYAARWIKKWTQREEKTQVFTMQDLRKMRDDGQLTEAEFQTMRAALLAQFGHKTAAAPKDQRPDAPPETE